VFLSKRFDDFYRDFLPERAVIYFQREKTAPIPPSPVFRDLIFVETFSDVILFGTMQIAERRKSRRFSASPLILQRREAIRLRRAALSSPPTTGFLKKSRNATRGEMSIAFSAHAIDTFCPIVRIICCKVSTVVRILYN
jgi:hypothetical protein